MKVSDISYRTMSAELAHRTTDAQSAAGFRLMKKLKCQNGFDPTVEDCNNYGGSRRPSRLVCQLHVTGSKPVEPALSHDHGKNASICVSKDRVPCHRVAGLIIELSAKAGNVSTCGEQVDKLIIAHWGDGFQRHMARALNSPLVILVEEQRADKPDDGVVVWKNAREPSVLRLISPFNRWIVATVNRMAVLLKHLASMAL